MVDNQLNIGELFSMQRGGLPMGYQRIGSGQFEGPELVMVPASASNSLCLIYRLVPIDITPVF